MSSASDEQELWQVIGEFYANKDNMTLKDEVVYNCSCGKCIVVPGARQEHQLLVCPYCTMRLNPPAPPVPPVIPSKEFP